MDMNKLNYFYTVYQTGSLIRASEHLNISQAALSKAIKSLEADFEQKLIIPSGRGIVLTDFGHRLVSESFELIQNFNQLKKKLIAQSKDETNRLRIGTFEVFSTYFLADLISSDFTSYNVDLVELLPGAIENAVREKKVDIGITYLPIPNPEIDILKISKIDMGIFGTQKFLKQKDLSLLDFVIPIQDLSVAPTRVRGLDGWPDDIYPRKIKYRVTLMESALQLCRQGLCVGYFPKFIIEKHNQCVQAKYQLKELSIDVGLQKNEQEVFLIKRKTDLEATDFKRIAKNLRMLNTKL